MSIPFGCIRSIFGIVPFGGTAHFNDNSLDAIDSISH
jgi:hypothetical protein